MPDLLIIEDEYSLMEALVDGLEAAFPDVQTKAAGSVEEARKLINGKPPELVISDVRLPGKSGLDFLIEASAEWPQTRFILMTAYASVNSEDILAHGALHFLRKPFALEEMIQCVRNSLKDDSYDTGQLRFALGDVMQVIHWSRKCSVVHVQTDDQKGEIYFHEGSIIHACAGKASGIEALETILSWEEVEFYTRPIDTMPTQTIEGSYENLLKELGVESPDRQRANNSPVDFFTLDPSPNPKPGKKRSRNEAKEMHSMAKVNLEKLKEIDGFVGTCLVDSDSGMVLGLEGGGPVNLEVAAAGNTQVVRAKRKTMQSLQLNDHIEDILITLKKAYHIIRPLETNDALFLYLVLDRSKSNLAMARHELKTFEKGLEL